MSDLNTAIQLVRQGNMAQAQKMLEAIVRTETGNVPAWLWYTQTFPSAEMRLKVLTACLKLNPENEQVGQAIRLIKAKMSPPTSPPAETPASQNSFSKPAEKPIELPPTFAQILAEQPQPIEPKPTFNWDELEQTSAPAAPVVPFLRQPVESKSAFNWDELEQTSAPVAPAFAAQAFPESQPDISETKSPARSGMVHNRVTN